MKRNGLLFLDKYENKNADATIRANDSYLQTLDGVRGFLFMKPFEAGSNIELKDLGEKILIATKNATKLKEWNFLLEGDHVEIRAGQGVKISSIHPNIIVVSVDSTKQDEAIYDFNQRIEVVEKSLATIMKILKVVNSWIFIGLGTTLLL